MIYVMVNINFMTSQLNKLTPLSLNIVSKDLSNFLNGEIVFIDGGEKWSALIITLKLVICYS